MHGAFVAWRFNGDDDEFEFEMCSSGARDILRCLAALGDDTMVETNILRYRDLDLLKVPWYLGYIFEAV